MEPAAPGTEDDPPIEFSSLNKRETEQERLLKQKAILKNGQYENIFELSYVNGAEHWFCKICQCPVMGRVYQHELGRRHALNLAMTNRHLDNPKTKVEPEREEPTLEVAPGEPVPPGYEGEVARLAQIQGRLDEFVVGPLVALEYLIEMQDYDPSKEPFYLCILCDKRGDPRTVLTHLASYNHISQYLQKHFPTCYRAMAPYMTKQYKRNWQAALQKIAEAIEAKFGRLRPFPIDKDKFEKDRLQYLTMICKGRHFSEHSGYTFQELVVHDELTRMYDDDKGDASYTASATSNWGGKPFIEKPFQKRSPSPPIVARPTKKAKPAPQAGQTPNPSGPKTQKRGGKIPPQGAQGVRRSLSSVSSISSGSDLEDNDDTGRNYRGRRGEVAGGKRRSPFIEKYSRDRKVPFNRDRRRTPSPKRLSPKRPSPKRGLMPWEKPNYNKQREVSEIRKREEREKERLDKLEEFKKLSKAIENDMEKTLKNHEKNPEKHPKYNDEWKMFWNRRYKELQAEGQNAANHDFKPEWIAFWGKRMIDLHQEEIKSRKDGLRKRLGLPEEPAPVSFRIVTGKPVKPIPKETKKPNLPMAAQPDNDPEVIIIEDKDDDRSSLNRSHSPWEQEPPPKSIGRSVTPKPKERVIVARKPTPVRDKKSSPVRENPMRKSRSPERRSTDRSTRRSKSRERTSMRRSRSRDRSNMRRSRSRDRSMRRSRSGERSMRRSRSRERRSRSRDKGFSRDRYARSRSRERRMSRDRSRERSWEKKRDYRESSFERDLRRDRIRTVADLPWEREKMAFRPEYEDYYKPPPMMRDATRMPMMVSTMVPPEEDEDDGEVNIVAVLRLLTAVEERLGSLGPKVIDLLAQALALEKKEPNSSETLLDNEINCVMFETVKEKLKGQLLAGLVDMVEERAFKKAIQKTASLIHIAGQRKRQREQLQPKAAVAVPGVGAVDKAAIAKQIANALIAQGKTDVTQAELEQLIDAVVGMAEASKNSAKPITTASFLDQLAKGGSSTPAPAKEVIITPSVKPSKLEEKTEKTEKTSKTPDIVDLEQLTEPLTPPSPERSTTGNMENLSDSDLQTLLQNFKDLSTDEQMNLINYLKKLELDEPERVETLRKFVNLGSKTDKEEEKTEIEEKEKKSGRESPFSVRLGGVNPAVDSLNTQEDNKKPDKPPAKIHLDSEDEDYTFEDVVKAVSKNVKDKEMEDNRKIVEDSIGFDTAAKSKDVDLTDAKALISNLMSSFSKNKSSSSINLLGLGTSTASNITPTTNTVTSSEDFTKTLNSINVASLASIVSSVQNMSPQTQTPPQNTQNRLHIDPENLRAKDLPERPNMSGPGAMNSRHFGPMGANNGPIRPLVSRGPDMMQRGPDMGPRGPMMGGPGPRGPPMGGNFRPDRPMVQYPQRGPNPYGANFQQNVSYPPLNRPRAPFNQNFGNNNRFGGPQNQFNNRQGSGYNRW